MIIENKRRGNIMKKILGYGFTVGFTAFLTYFVTMQNLHITLLGDIFRVECFGQIWEYFF